MENLTPEENETFKNIFLKDKERTLKRVLNWQTNLPSDVLNTAPFFTDKPIRKEGEPRANGNWRYT